MTSTSTAPTSSSSSSTVNTFLTNLEEEGKILSKLIYRNKNQHGKYISDDKDFCSLLYSSKLDYFTSLHSIFSFSVDIKRCSPSVKDKNRIARALLKRISAIVECAVKNIKC